MAKNEAAPDSLSHDFFYKRRVTVFQYRRGYRFSLDAPILADFLPASAGPVLEIGAGSGVISLLALYRDKFPAVTALELQPRLAQLARRNAEQNGLADRLAVVAGDFNEVYKNFAGCDLVFANPPFAKTGHGRLSRSEELRLAKFEVALTLAGLIEKSAEILASGGRLCLIFPFARHAELSAVTDACRLFPGRIRRVQPFAGTAPDRILIEWRKGGALLQELPPLVIFRSKGVYSTEMDAIFSG